MKVEKLAKNGQMVQNCYPLSPWCGLSDNFLSGMIEGSSEHDTFVISFSNNLLWLFETKLSPRIAADSMNVSAPKYAMHLLSRCMCKDIPSSFFV